MSDQAKEELQKNQKNKNIKKIHDEDVHNKKIDKVRTKR